MDLKLKFEFEIEIILRSLLYIRLIVTRKVECMTQVVMAVIMQCANDDF